LAGSLSGFDEGGSVAGADAAACRVSLTAIFRQIGEQIIHGGIFGRVDQRPAFTAERDEASVAELVQVERKAIRRHPKPLGDLTSGQTVSACLNEQPEHIKAGVLGESR
jgi:hypothetical protein